jgi:hypothetical protein
MMRSRSRRCEERGEEREEKEKIQVGIEGSGLSGKRSIWGEGKQSGKSLFLKNKVNWGKVCEKVETAVMIPERG